MPSPVIFLDGLEDAPDAGAAKRMQAFDDLHPDVRRALDTCAFDFNPLQARGLPATVLTKIRNSEQVELVRLGYRAPPPPRKLIWD